MTDKEFDDKFDKVLEAFNKNAFSHESFEYYTNQMAQNFNNASSLENKIAALTSFVQTYCTDYSSELIRTMLKEFIVSKN